MTIKITLAGNKNQNKGKIRSKSKSILGIKINKINIQLQ